MKLYPREYLGPTHNSFSIKYRITHLSTFILLPTNATDSLKKKKKTNATDIPHWEKHSLKKNDLRVTIMGNLINLY